MWWIARRRAARGGSGVGASRVASGCVASARRPCDVRLRRTRRDADGVGTLAAASPAAGRGGLLADVASAGRASPRARAREAPRLPDSAPRPARLRRLLVQSARLDGGAAAARRARARLRRSRSVCRDPRLRLRRPPARSCPLASHRAGARLVSRGHGASFTARRKAHGDSRSGRSAAFAYARRFSRVRNPRRRLRRPARRAASRREGRGGSRHVDAGYGAGRRATSRERRRTFNAARGRAGKTLVSVETYADADTHANPDADSHADSELAGACRGRDRCR